MITKVVVSPKNTKVIAFFEELEKKKDELKKKLESKNLFANTKAGKPSQG